MYETGLDIAANLWSDWLIEFVALLQFKLLIIKVTAKMFLVCGISSSLTFF